MLKLKNTTELKNSIKGLNIRQKQAEERISELEERLFEIIQSEGGKEKKEKT